MILNAHIERAIAQLHGLDQPSVRREAGEREPCGGQRIAVIVVEFIAMAMALGDGVRAVAARHGGAGLDYAGIRAQAQRAALVNIIALTGHEVDDLVRAQLVKFAGMRIGDARHISRVFDHGDLHAKADAEVGQALFAGIARGQQHAVDAASAEAAGHDDAIQTAQERVAVFRRQVLGIDPVDVDVRAQRVARMAHGFGYGEVGVVQLHILAHQPDLHHMLARLDALDHLRPLGQLRLGRVDMQLTADDLGKRRLFQHQRRFVEVGQGDVFNYTVGLDVAEHRDLLENGGLQRLIAAQHDDIGIDAHALQLLHGMLGGLGFVLVRAAQERHQRYMDEQAVFAADLQRNLAHGFNEGLGFDVADRAADLSNDHVGARLLAHAVYEILDLVCDVRNDLHRGTQIFAAALLVEHVPVNLAGGQVGIAVQILVDEALIVPQIQIRFSAVLGDVDLAVLVGAHRAGIDVDIGVELLCGDLQPARLEQTSERRRRNALAQSGNHAAGYKDILCHDLFLHPCSTITYL